MRKLSKAGLVIQRKKKVKILPGNCIYHLKLANQAPRSGAKYATECTFILPQQFFRGVNNKIKKYVTSEK